MRMPLFRSPIAGSLLALSFLAGCGDDNGSGPSGRLTTEDVGRDYAVCSLDFDPSGETLPPVDVLAASDVGTAPRLELDDQSQFFSMVYRPTGGTTQTLRGTYDLGASTVRLNFNDPSSAFSTLLLPNPLTLDYSDTPPTLVTAGTQSTYTVPRATYEDLLGREDPNFPSQVEGQLTATFSTDCG